MFLEFLKSRIVYCLLVFLHPSLRDSFFRTQCKVHIPYISHESRYSLDQKKVSSRSRLGHSRVSSRKVWQTSRSRELRSRSWSRSRPRRSWAHPCRYLSTLEPYNTVFGVHSVISVITLAKAQLCYNRIRAINSCYMGTTDQIQLNGERSR